MTLLDALLLLGYGIGTYVAVLYGLSKKASNQEFAALFLFWPLLLLITACRGLVNHWRHE